MWNFASAVLGHELSDGKIVQHTRTRELWYKIIVAEKCLYIPSIEYLKSSVLDLEACSEAIHNFDACNLDEVAECRWNTDWVAEHSLSDGALPLLLGVKGDVAVDIETRDLGYDGNELIAIGFCWDSSEGETVLTVQRPFSDYTLGLLKTIFSRKEINFIWHNGKFDTEHLEYLNGIQARVDDDIMLMHYVGINEKRGTQSLKFLGPLYLQAPKWDEELQDYKKKWCRQHGIKLKDFKFDMIPVEILIPYLRCDCLATFRLYKVFRNLMRPDSQWIYSKLIEASNVFKRIELNGIKLDIEYAVDLERQLVMERDEANEVVNEILIHNWDWKQYCNDTGAKVTKTVAEFSMKSPKKLKWLLSKLMGFEVPKTDKAELDKLIEHIDEVENEQGRLFLTALMKVRKANKYLDAYAVGLQKVVCSDGRIRCTYNLAGTETGRLSASEPNMQQIPRDKRIKNLIICEPGKILINMDMSQAEIRTLAAVTGDMNLAEAYYEDKDLHATMAEKVFGPNWTKEERSMVKTITFGLIYGRGPDAIASAFGITKSKAKKLIDDWFRAAPDAKKWIYKMKNQPFTGEEYVTPFGRTRHYVITDDNKWHISNEAVNMPIQSIASDITLMSILDIQRWLEEEEMDRVAKIVATVHDSIVLEVEDDADIIAKVIKVGKSIMASQADKYEIGPIKVPFKADAECGYAYGNMKEIEL